MNSLTFVEWCCLVCRRPHRGIVWVAEMGACKHGAKCAWGEDKWDGSCVPTGQPSETLAGLSDAPVAPSEPTMAQLIAQRPGRRQWKKSA